MANDKLNTEKNSAEELLKNAKAALEQAEKSVESAKYAVRVHQDRKSTGDGLVIAGAALLALPFIGWISGSIMICEGERLINEASRAIRDAEDELKENESQKRRTKIMATRLKLESSRTNPRARRCDRPLFMYSK
ncbi:uncharacterized protein LOC107673007 isoform X2 [Sinocyclocheilus anshuiensis]|uniref:uncharacterized protein LOC107673007 isoform X2 n=1 Tax=Sinocyclocheilus anshuiensis TaxID=1608454 RepID=UPI0007B989AF|nr:PREDICTED: uncharacterized protein LOC107673007 isoform X2 [Sinocyclocheilus anshuiensis]